MFNRISRIMWTAFGRITKPTSSRKLWPIDSAPLLCISLTSSPFERVMKKAKMKPTLSVVVPYDANMLLLRRPTSSSSTSSVKIPSDITTEFKSSRKFSKTSGFSSKIRTTMTICLTESLCEPSLPFPLLMLTGPFRQPP